MAPRFSFEWNKEVPDLTWIQLTTYIQDKIILEIVPNMLFSIEVLKQNEMKGSLI